MKTKQLLLIIVIITSSFSLKAQDKYEFMIIEYNTLTADLAVSIDGATFKKEDINFNGQKKSGYNATPILLKVKEYQEENWEVMSFDTKLVTKIVGSIYVNDEIFFAYLRKKNDNNATTN